MRSPTHDDPIYSSIVTPTAAILGRSVSARCFCGRRGPELAIGPPCAGVFGIRLESSATSGAAGRPGPYHRPSNPVRPDHRRNQPWATQARQDAAPRRGFWRVAIRTRRCVDNRECAPRSPRMEARTEIPSAWSQHQHPRQVSHQRGPGGLELCRHRPVPVKCVRGWGAQGGHPPTESLR